MARYDGSLNFDTNINTKGFNNGVVGIASKLKIIGSTIAGAFITKKIIECTQEAEKYQNALTGLKSILEGQGRSFSTAQKFIESYTSDGLITATEAITAYKNLALRGYDTSQIEKVMTALKDSATYSRQASYGLGEAVATATEGLKNENSVVVDNAGVTKNVAKMWEEYAASIGKTSNNLTQAEKIQAEVNGILEETKFQTGDAVTYANSFSGMIAKLSASFTTLKQTLGGAFMQIAQAILPSIQLIINYLIKLANVFAQVVSLIFNKQVNTNNNLAKSSKTATSAIKKQGDAAQKAGKQAKGALLDFDKLTVLQDNSSSNSNSSATSAGTGANMNIADPIGKQELGNDVTVSPKVLECFETIKSIIETFKDWININFVPIFDEISKEIIPQIENTKAIIKNMFNDLKKLTVPLSTWFYGSFTELLKEIIKLFGNITNQLLNTVNIVFLSLWNNCVYPILQNFISIGLPLITDFLTETVKALNTLVTAVSFGFNKLYEEAIEPILISITNIWNETWETISEWWNEWGKVIFDNINKAISTTGDVLNNIWNVTIKPIVDTICENIDWIWEKHLKELLNNFLDFIAELVNGALEIYNKFILPIVSFLNDIFGPTFVTVFSTIVGFVGTKIAAIIDYANSIVTILKGVIQFITGVFTLDWQKAWQGIVNVFKGIVDGIGSIFKAVLNSIIDIINASIKGIVSGVNNLLGKVNVVTSKVGIPNIPTITTPKIPKLAQGAVIPPRQEFMAVLGDQKYGKNLEAPEDLIRQIVREESGSKKITIINKTCLDSKEMAESIKEVNLEEEITSPDIDGGGVFAY